MEDAARGARRDRGRGWGWKRQRLEEGEAGGEDAAPGEELEFSRAGGKGGFGCFCFFSPSNSLSSVLG